MDLLHIFKIPDIFNIINKNNNKIHNILYICNEWNKYFIRTTHLWTLLYKFYSEYRYNAYKDNVLNIDAVTQKEYKWLTYDRLREFKTSYCKRCNLFNPHHITFNGYCGGKYAACMSKDSKIPCVDCKSTYLTKWTGRFEKYMCKSCRQEKFNQYFIPKYERDDHLYTDSKYICPAVDNNFSWNY